MILIQNRELLIPNTERYLGTTYDDSVENRVFQMPRFSQSGTDMAELVFKIDLEYPTGDLDTDDLTKEVDEEMITLIWNVGAGALQNVGTVFIQVRAFDGNGTVRYASFKGSMYVNDAINTPENYQGELTELETLEAEMAEHLERLDEYGVEAEKWATGEHNGTPVEAEEDQYENNAKYYAEQAGSKASAAAASATNAHGSEVNAASSATNALGSAQTAAGHASNASQSASSASASAGAASGSKEAAAISASNAASAAARAESAAGESVKFTPQELTEEQKQQARDNIGVGGAVAVSSFNGRTGAVMPAEGDYTASQVGAVPNADKGVAGGVASLGENGKIPEAQLPARVVSFNGRSGEVSPQSGDYTPGQVGVNAHSLIRIGSFAPKTTVINGNSITETGSDYTLVTTINGNTITDVLTKNGVSVTKTTVINGNTITETIEEEE